MAGLKPDVGAKALQLPALPVTVAADQALLGHHGRQPGRIGAHHDLRTAPAVDQVEANAKPSPCDFLERDAGRAGVRSMHRLDAVRQVDGKTPSHDEPVDEALHVTGRHRRQRIEEPVDHAVGEVVGQGAQGPLGRERQSRLAPEQAHVGIEGEVEAAIRASLRFQLGPKWTLGHLQRRRDGFALHHDVGDGGQRTQQRPRQVPGGGPVAVVLQLPRATERHPRGVEGEISGSQVADGRF